MAEEPGRPMKYPYTFTAKFAQFPFKFHFENHWMYKYGLIGILASVPIIYQFHKLARSPANIRQWEEKKRLEKEARAHGHH